MKKLPAHDTDIQFVDPTFIDALFHCLRDLLVDIKRLGKHPPSRVNPVFGHQTFSPGRSCNDNLAYSRA